MQPIANFPKCSSSGGFRVPKGPSSTFGASVGDSIMSLGRYDVLLRLLLLGDSGVGKTSFMSRFAGDHVNGKHVSTIGVDFKLRVINVGDKRARVQMWDTAGQERYRSIINQYYRKAEGILLVFDMTNEDSFLSVRRWMDEIKEYAEKDVKVTLVANKYDLASHREVSRRQGEELAASYDVPYVETSAMQNTNIQSTVEAICRQVLVQKETSLKRQTSRRPETIPSQVLEEEKSGRCCSSS